MIDLKEVNKIYPNGVHAINAMNLHIDSGEFVYVIGSTGSGKSTLIKLLNAEEVPDGGTINVDGVSVGSLKHRQVPGYRRRIGCVFQDYRLLPNMTVYENVAFALEVVGMSRKKIRQRVAEVLDLVGLSEKSRSYPDELSGGQQQRVTIARAIANKPSLLIADEPTGNLDPEMSQEILHLLEKINETYGTTVIMATHDQNLVDAFKKRTLILEGGYIVHDFPKGGYKSISLFNQPQNVCEVPQDAYRAINTEDLEKLKEMDAPIVPDQSAQPLLKEDGISQEVRLDEDIHPLRSDEQEDA